MDNTLIELNRNQASVKDGTLNSVWKNSLKQPLRLNPGDQLRLKNSFINIKNSDFDSILIEEDTTVSVTMGYHHLNFNKTGKTWTPSGAVVEDYDIYVLRYDGTQQTKGETVSYTYSFVIKAGRYTNGGLAKTMTDLMSEALNNKDVTDNDIGEGGFLTNPDDWDGIFFKWDSDPTNGATPYFEGVGMSAGGTTASGASSQSALYYVGASTPSLLWDEDTQRFRLYLSYSPDKDGETGVWFQYLPTPQKWKKIQLYSGGHVLNLQPTEFWEQKLNFDISKVKVPITEYWDSPTNLSYKYPANFSNYLTSLFVDSDMIKTISNDAGAVGQNNWAFSPTTTFNALESDTVNEDITDGGYYMVEITTDIPYSSFVNDQAKNNNIWSCISKQYRQVGYITDFQGSTPITITQPVNLSHFNVRILEAETKEPATALNTNNTLILEVIRNPNTPKLIQEKNEETKGKEKNRENRKLGRQKCKVLPIPGTYKNDALHSFLIKPHVKRFLSNFNF